MFFLREFGVLWMYRHGGTAEAAARKVFQLARNNPADFLCYLLIRFAMSIVFFIVSLLVGCLTCCLGFLPYLRSVTILPLTVFRVWYSIECFAQLGPDCDVRSENPPPIPLIEPPPIGP